MQGGFRVTIEGILFIPKNKRFRRMIRGVLEYLRFFANRQNGKSRSNRNLSLGARTLLRIRPLHAKHICRPCRTRILTGSQAMVHGPMSLCSSTAMLAACSMQLTSNNCARTPIYLKEIADLFGFRKKLTTHTVRHTFATTVL